ncbi:MAG: hypothetical protein ABIJ18_00075 [archaeon]
MKKFLLVFLVIFLVGCTNPIVNNNVITSNLYEGDGYTIESPEGWITAPGGNVVVFMNTEKQLVQIVVDVQDADSLANFWDNELDRLERSEILLGTNTLQDVMTTVNGYDAVVIDYEYGSNIKAQETAIYKSGKVFIITYQTEEDYFNDYKTDFEDSLATFRLS